MYPKIALLLLASTTLIATTGCGGKKRCTEKNPASFATFLDEEWRSYCSEYNAHLTSPGSYTLTDLAKFFGAHPDRVEELNKSLYGHDQYETCFDGAREELELRELQSCLQDNDATDVEISKSYMAVGKPWVEDLELRQGGIEPKIIQAEAETARLTKKIEEAFSGKYKLEGRDYEELQASVADIGASLDALDGAPGLYQEIVDNARGNDGLVSALEKQLAPSVNALSSDNSALRERYDALQKESSYMEFAWNSAGVECPKSAKGASKELKIAKKVVKGRDNEVGGSGPRVLRKIRPDSVEDTDFERFEGFVCGIRGPENQFEGKPQLCGQFRFVVERQKPADERKWGDWSLKTFEESGSSGGVDCALKKK